MGFNPHGFAGIAAAFGNCTVKHPGVATQQGALLAFSQSNGFHGPIVAAQPSIPDLRWNLRQ